MSPTPDEYFAAYSGPLKETFDAIRAFVRETLPHAPEEVRNTAVVYLTSGAKAKIIVQMYAGKDHIHFGFQQGAKLDDPDSLLQGTGFQRHIKMKSPKDIKKAQFKKWMLQAEQLASAK